MAVPPTHSLPGRVEPWGVLEENWQGLFQTGDIARKGRGGDFACGLQQNLIFVCLLVFFIQAIWNYVQLLDKRSFDLKAASKISERSLFRSNTSSALDTNSKAFNFKCCFSLFPPNISSSLFPFQYRIAFFSSKSLYDIFSVYIYIFNIKKYTNL